MLFAKQLNFCHHLWVICQTAKKSEALVKTTMVESKSTLRVGPVEFLLSLNNGSQSRQGKAQITQ